MGFQSILRKRCRKGWRHFALRNRRSLTENGTLHRHDGVHPVVYFFRICSYEAFLQKGLIHGATGFYRQWEMGSCKIQLTIHDD